MSEQASICPYCQSRLEKFPAHKKKCPNCGNYIYVRTSPKTHEKILIREEEIQAIESEWQANLEETRNKSFLSKYISDLKRFGVTEERLKKSLYSNPVDIIWDIYNELVSEITKKHELEYLSQIYYSMAIFVDREKRGNPFELLKQSAYWKLIAEQEIWKKTGLEYIAIISAIPDSCETCKKQDGLKFSIQEALEKMPIPHKECTFTLNGTTPFCRCMYLFGLK